MTTRPVAITIFCLLAALAPAVAGDRPAATTTNVVERTFSFVSIPSTTATIATLSTFTFKNTVGGQMVVDARGYCNLYPHAANPNTVIISIRQASQAPFDTARLPGWGIAAIPSGPGSTPQQVGWSSHYTAGASIGPTRTVVVEATHQEIPTGAADCTGTVSMEIR